MYQKIVERSRGTHYGMRLVVLSCGHVAQIRRYSIGEDVWCRKCASRKVMENSAAKDDETQDPVHPKA